MKSHLARAVGVVAVLTAGAATAETLLFTYTTPNGAGGSAIWTQSSTPVVDGYDPSNYTTVAVTNGIETYPGSAPLSFSQVYYPILGADGGFNTLLNQISPPGPQIYSGPETAPVFTTGTYNLYGGGTLVVSLAGIPEPAAWTMMLLGVAVLGGVLRARRESRFVAA
jgi:hypothetical protein